ncbi:MAG: sugar porter family MFS transporter [Bacteroidales bacterium]|nr:sugar porter family MFS transporter [Bacteroidales bacterium]MBS3774714.1 sugar porter family MFS transporter [Bacteroidales bacterium]
MKSHSAKSETNISYLLTISIIASLGGLMFGFDMAIISGTVPFITDYFDLSDLQLGWGVSSMLVGAVIGAMFAGNLADRFGRRRMLIITALFFAISALGTGLAQNFTFFYMMRILGGIAVGAGSALSPMYISEVSPSQYRGRMVVLYQMSIVVGILISYIVNYGLHDIGENNWRWMFATGTLPSVIFFVLLFIVPKSPRWLYKKGYTNQAYNILKNVGGTANADYEIAEIKESLKQAHARFRELFQPGLRRVMIIGIVLAILVQMTGINTIIDYAPKVLEDVGVEVGEALFYNIGIGLINFLFTWVAVLLIDRAGRRKLYIVGSAGMVMAMVFLSVAFSLENVSGILILVFMFLFISFFASCIGPVFWTLMSEIFPNKARGTAMSVAVVTNWIFNWLVVFIFPGMMGSYGGTVTYGFLAVMSLILLIVAVRYLPETKGKTLEEIEMIWQPKD